MTPTATTLPLTPLQAHRIQFLVVGAIVTTVSVFAIAWFATHLFTFSLIGSAVMGVTAGVGVTLFILSFFHRPPPPIPPPHAQHDLRPRPPSVAESEESFASCESHRNTPSPIDQPREVLAGWVALTTAPQPDFALDTPICYPPLSEITEHTNFAPLLQTMLAHYFWVSNQQTLSLLNLYRRAHPNNPEIANQRQEPLFELRRTMEGDLLTRLQNPETGLPLLISFALNGILSSCSHQEAAGYRAGRHSLAHYCHHVLHVMSSLDPSLEEPTRRWIDAINTQVEPRWHHHFPFANPDAQKRLADAYDGLAPKDQLPLLWAFHLLLLYELDACFKKSWGCLVEQLTGTGWSVSTQRAFAIRTGLAPRAAVAAVVNEQIKGTPFASPVLSTSRESLIGFAHDLSPILFNHPFIEAFKRANLATIHEPHPGRFVQQMNDRMNQLA